MQRLNVLIVEDQASDAELMVAELRRGGFDPDWRRVDTEAEYVRLLDETAGPPADIVLSDFNLPQFTGLRALQLLRQRDPDTPFILISGTVGEDVAVEVMKEGATDYLLKDRLTRLSLSVGHALDQKELRSAKRRAEEEARRLARVIEESPTIVVITDTDELITYVNPQFTRATGYAPDEVVGTPARNLADPPDPREQDAQRAALRAGGTWRGELKVRRKDGSFYWELASVSAMRGPDGENTHYVKVAEDISDRKRAEEHAERRLAQLQALRDIDMAISGSLDARVTLSIFVDKVTTHLRADAADVLLLNPRSQLLEYMTGRGFRTTALQHTRLRLGSGYAGQAALERRIIAVPDLREAKGELDKSPLLPEEDFVSYFAAPLIAKGQVQGVLEVFTRRRLDPDQEWMDFLATLAGQAGIAIDSTTSYNNLQRANAELILAYDTTLEGWSRALDLRDKETEGHTQRVTELTLRLARVMGMSDDALVHVRRGALLHDMGKMGIPDGILLKPGQLTEEEWVVMRRHPVYAYQMLLPITYLRPALAIPYSHHEKWDGTGYPRSLKGEDIPLEARVFAVIDVWDALTSDRPYRMAWPKDKAQAFIREQSGKHFDPAVVDAFLRLGL